MDHRDALLVAMTLADHAADVTLSYFGRGTLESRFKVANGARVTEADVTTELELRGLISQLSPKDTVLGEEIGGTSVAHGTWIIDPIDGTENFSRGNPIWGRDCKNNGVTPIMEVAPDD